MHSIKNEAHWVVTSLLFWITSISVLRMKNVPLGDSNFVLLACCFCLHCPVKCRRWFFNALTASKQLIFLIVFTGFSSCTGSLYRIIISMLNRRETKCHCKDTNNNFYHFEKPLMILFNIWLSDILPSLLPVICMSRYECTLPAGKHWRSHQPVSSAESTISAGNAG
jgi:hypothetical protein